MKLLRSGFVQLTFSAALIANGTPVAAQTQSSGAAVATQTQNTAVTAPDASGGAATAAVSRKREATARILFEAGADAYAAGLYQGAVRAFAKAYAIAPRPGLLFSIAQCYRQRYYEASTAEDAQRATAYLRMYLTKGERGSKRAEAAQALRELEAIVGRAEPPPEAPFTDAQLMVFAGLPDARVEVDGKSGTLPFVDEVRPGLHRVRVTAPGYEPFSTDVVMLAGDVVALRAELTPVKALLKVQSPVGAAVFIDDQRVGTAPLEAVVPPGSHELRLAQRGRVSRQTNVDLQRAESVTVDAELDTSTERKAAYVSWGAALASLAATVALGAMSAHADDYADERPPGSDGRQRRAARAESLRSAAFVTGGASALLFGAGLTFYLWDGPGGSRPIRVKVAPTAEPAP
jgi:hypothetical protein